MIPDYVTSIANEVFKDDTNLKAINISKSLISIETSVFNGYSTLANYT